MATVASVASESGTGKLRLGSICSGSGGGEIGMQVILRVLGMLLPEQATVGGAAAGDAERSVECAFYCEYIKTKADWMRANLNPPAIFANAGYMGDAKTLDLLSNSFKSIPVFELLLAGFSCKDLSILNNDRTSKSPEIEQVLRKCFVMSESEVDAMVKDKKSSTTAVTLSGVLRYIGPYKPRRFVLENVKALAKIIRMIQEVLAPKGYITAWIETCPSDLGMPVTRPRVYMVGKFDPSQVWLAYVGASFSSGFESLAKQLVHRVLVSSRISIENFLFAMDDPTMEYWMEQKGLGSALRGVILRGEDDPINVEVAWETRHCQIFIDASIPRPSSKQMDDWIKPYCKTKFQLDMFMAMPRRCQEIVCFEFKQHVRANPSQVPLARDVSQSLWCQGNFVDKVSCLTGSSDHWLFEVKTGRKSEMLFRRLLGEEAMSLQGLTRHNFPFMRSKGITNHFLMDLAGNAFCVPCLNLALFCLLAH